MGCVGGPQMQLHVALWETERVLRQTWRRRQCEDGAERAKDVGDVATSEGMLAAPEAGRGKAKIPPKGLQGSMGLPIA